jgi:hypothetical protein
VQPIEEAMVAMAIAQIAAQTAAADNNDLKAMGLLGFNGALVAANVALKDSLHHLWWLPLPGIVISIAMCLLVSRHYEFEAGPPAALFYAAYGGQTSVNALAQLVADLDFSFQHNLGPLTEKRKWFGRALVTLLATALVAAIVWPITE